MSSSAGGRLRFGSASLAGNRRIAKTREQWRERWLRGLGWTVAIGSFAYIIMGIPAFAPSPDDVVAVTDVAANQVSPIHRMIWIALFLLSSPILWARRRDLIRLLLASWPLMVISAWFVASAFWAIDPASSERRVLLHLVLIGVMAAPLLALGDVRKIHFALAIICAATAVMNLGALAVAHSASMSDLGFTGLFSQKNVTGMVMMISFLVTTSAGFMVRGNFYRLMFWSAATVAFGLLLLTRSSTSTSLALVGLMVMGVIAALNRLEPKLVRSGLIFAGLMLILAVLGYDAGCAMLNVDPFAPLKGVTFTQRTDIWTFEWGAILKRPWFGYGFGSFWSIDPAIQPSYKATGWFANPSAGINQGHDGYLDILATTGLVGLMLTLVVFGRALFVAWRLVEYVAARRRTGQANSGTPIVPLFILAMLVVTLIHNVTESTLFADNGALGQIFVYMVLVLEWANLSINPAAPSR